MEDSIDIWLLPKFPSINFFNLSLELYIGFFLLFLSYFVDAIDQIFIHSIFYTVLLEKATLVCAAIFIFVGSTKWMKCYEDIAHTDYLTQIPNRKLISQLVNEEISNCNQKDSFLSLAMIDIDYFKNINDKFGKNTGRNKVEF